VQNQEVDYEASKLKPLESTRRLGNDNIRSNTNVDGHASVKSVGHEGANNWKGKGGCPTL